jgi:hypothetical protein
MHLVLSHNRQSASERNDSRNQRKAWYHAALEIFAFWRGIRQLRSAEANSQLAEFCTRNYANTPLISKPGGSDEIIGPLLCHGCGSNRDLYESSREGSTRRQF